MSHCQNRYQQVKWPNFGEFPSNLAFVNMYVLHENGSFEQFLVNCE